MVQPIKLKSQTLSTRMPLIFICARFIFLYIVVSTILLDVFMLRDNLLMLIHLFILLCSLFMISATRCIDSNEYQHAL